MNYVTGITANDERLRFERWLYESWRRGDLYDEYLIADLNRCIHFVIHY